MPLLRLRQPRQDISCDGRWVFVELLEDGKAKVNSEPAPSENLSAIVGQLMESRAERVVYLLPSRGISFYRFVETLKYIGALCVKRNTSVFKLGEKFAGENKPPDLSGFYPSTPLRA